MFAKHKQSPTSKLNQKDFLPRHKTSHSIDYVADESDDLIIGNSPTFLVEENENYVLFSNGPPFS